MSEHGFSAEEFRQRREKVFDMIGEDAIAVLQGADYAQAMCPFRQTNEFFYLTGIEVAHAYVVMDGKTRKTTLYPAPRRRRYPRSMTGPCPARKTPITPSRSPAPTPSGPLKCLARCSSGAASCTRPSGPARAST